MRSVLLTRPAGQPEPLRTLIEASGRASIAFPALAIGPPESRAEVDDALAHLDDFALVVFVSPNAIDHALQGRSAAWPAGVAIGVMGPGSRARLAAFGIDESVVTVFSPARNHEQRFDSEALFAAFDIARLAGKRCLVVRGNGGRTWLIDALGAHGVHVTSVEAYRRSIGAPEPQAIAAVANLIETSGGAVVVVTSSEALVTLPTLFQQFYGASGVAWLHAQPVLVTHARIAENATAAGFVAVHRCGPGDEALVRALEYLP